MNGTVKWFNPDKGYGFIEADDSGQDYFVHHTGITGEGFKSLEQGLKVEFEVADGQRGLYATSVKVIKTENGNQS